MWPSYLLGFSHNPLLTEVLTVMLASLVMAPDGRRRNMIGLGSSSFFSALNQTTVEFFAELFQSGSPSHQADVFEIFKMKNILLKNKKKLMILTDYT